MPPRAVRDGSSSAQANDSLRWPGLYPEQAQIVINYLMDDDYRSERVPSGSHWDRQRLALHDAIYIHFNALERHLHGLMEHCAIEIVHIALSLPLLSFLCCITGYREWVHLNSGWFSPVMYHYIQYEMPDAAIGDVETFRALDFIDEYSRAVALLGPLFTAFDQLIYASRTGSGWLT
ncbi:hypothetical protein NXS19_005650 [Fusarium pseudograminearum]|uniref:Uncharacterized protein n=1 Tax=Fusarium pseudograminearum (strain CS3096) TaxID=1028729 RepID=K3V482_FUSPC|nr:hypothetical protein FPSE_12010 [Fusarium pseudograminearum CS3096]EKJ67862.1 hypothetical protein FPSE_12010 [Fusarium pseudograminearum CS3096]KAF0645711.1 hypothetical protein FPSE5266_12010 [Fusarium pseudograminearum]UZP37834.1 hypothetical protein NXS19_005650 [Fusarium pseudograminearum]